MNVLLFISLGAIGLGILYLIFWKTGLIVPEDHNAVVVNRQGFIKRVLPAGVHHLKLGLEKVDFIFETKPTLVKGTVTDISTAEGISLRVNWSGVYNCDAGLITEQVSQRLRALPSADNILHRQVDLTLRRLIGAYNLQDLFKPTIRERVERQLTQTLQSALKPNGIAISKIDLQAILLPEEVAKAINQAKAIQTLDAVIRVSDKVTHEVVTGSHKLEELLEWKELLPPYGRYVLSTPSLKQPAAG
jgi:regulator of protease activity HflC (stomatin/prohibitin superfamily)